MTLPQHLAQFEATGGQDGEKIAQFEIGKFKNFVYLILDWETKKAALVDPQKDLSQPLEFLSRFNFKLETILLTHTHFDHIAGVPELIQSQRHLSIRALRVHALDLHRLDDALRNHPKLQIVEDCEIIRIGNLKVQALHTPGHSAGEVCYLLEGEPPTLFTGDTLFIRDCGRTDGDSGSDSEMFASLQKIKNLPKTTVILPGHHYQPECASTLAKECVESAPLRCQTVQELSTLP